MSGMNAFLADYYGTAASPSAEEVAQAQQIDFFAKTAAANGIDLSQLDQNQINWLWGQVFTKTAEEAGEDKKEEGKEEEKAKEEKAKEEYEEKKEAMAKIAEADFLGRVIAHSMWDESDKIAQDRQAYLHKAAEEEAKKEEAKKEDEKEKESSVSSLDLKAAELALSKIASSNYWDLHEAADRLKAVLTLGAGESVKIASAPNFGAAVDIRSLELLELAGYPIQWNG